ncbi:MAG: hypothetical protein JWP75_4151 [Frondihabitans sp.]|nr:hypothetical protein [Frondihabitans sp.]
MNDTTISDPRVVAFLALMKSGKATYKDLREHDRYLADVRLRAAVKLVSPTWEEFAYMMGRNELPWAVSSAHTCRVITDLDELAKGVMDAWTGAEFPMAHLTQVDWLELFHAVGFIENAVRAEPPVDLRRLYRGATPNAKRRWSWTDDVEQAEWFAARSRTVGLDDAKVWTAEVQPSTLLAHFPGGREEAEWVINTRGVKITEYSRG